MNNINDLQELWNEQQETPVGMDAKRIIPEFARKLKKYERFQNKVNVFKIVAVVTALVPFIMIMLKYMADSIMLTIGFVGVVAAIALFIIYYMKMQFRLSDVDFTDSPKSFAKSTRNKLNNQIKVFGQPFILFIVTLILCMNLIYWDVTQGVEIMIKIGLHAGVTTFLIIMALIGLKIRKYRIRRETMPLITELSSFLTE